MNLLAESHFSDGDARGEASESLNFVQRQRILDSIAALSSPSPGMAFTLEAFTNAMRDFAPLTEPHPGMINTLVRLHNVAAPDSQVR